jgi:hypothetical protein
VLSELSSPAALGAAAMFLYAAVAKLRSPSSTRAAVAGFGLPAPIATLLAPLELVTALLLLAAPRVGGALAATLLVSFTAVVLAALRRGAAVRCGCFGGTDQRPVGPDTVARNGFLIALVVICLLGSSRLRAPSLPAVLTLGAYGAVALMSVALVRVRSEIGTLFGQSIPARGGDS